MNLSGTLRICMKPPVNRASRVEIAVVLALALIAAVLLLTLRRDGHDWGGDFSLYISHARNLAEGRPYAATGYIPDPYFGSHSPNTYPPLFPFLLAPLYAGWGLNYNVLKIPGIVCFALSIPILFLIFRKDLPARRAFFAIFLWAGWPFILEFKDQVLPDLIFTFLFAVALWLMRDAYDRFPAGEPDFRRAALIGLALYAAYATRSIGIVFPAALGAYEIIRYRRIRRFAVSALGVFAVLAILQNVIIHSDTSYYQMFQVKLVANMRLYAYLLSTVFTDAISGWLRGLRYLLTAVMGVLAAAGFLVQLRRLRSPAEIAFAFYGAMLLLWSAGMGIRYLVPVMPLGFFYAICGLDFLPAPPRLHALMEGVLATLVLAAYLSEYRTFDPGPIAGGVRTPGFAEMCAYVKDHSRPDDAFIFVNPRVFSLYTRRPAGAYPVNGRPDLTWKYANSIQARYLIETDILEPDPQVLQPFVQRYSTHLHMVYANPHFRIFALEPVGSQK